MLPAPDGPSDPVARTSWTLLSVNTKNIKYIRNWCWGRLVNYHWHTPWPWWSTRSWWTYVLTVGCLKCVENTRLPLTSLMLDTQSDRCFDRCFYLLLRELWNLQKACLWRTFRPLPVINEISFRHRIPSFRIVQTLQGCGRFCLYIGRHTRLWNVKLLLQYLLLLLKLFLWKNSVVQKRLCISAKVCWWVTTPTVSLMLVGCND